MATPKICLLANGPSQDFVGQRIMKAMKKIYGSSNLQFVGYGGYFYWIFKRVLLAQIWQMKV